ncbi:MAG: 4Fe-4S binding protein [Desulfobacterium sp.]|nr:4Fe-4S binding protein [Desulfobacterium sp.]
MDQTQPDPFLEKRVKTYDQWLERGEISFSSRVIPVSESIEAKKWVLPTDRAMEIVNSATSIALQPCECRSHYQRCDHPLDTCLLFDQVGDRLIAKGQARQITPIEAAEVLKKANKSGLVHLTLYMPDHKIFALCSCCSCCCHDLQIVKQYHRKELMMRSDFVPVTDKEACIHCGACVDRCVVAARQITNDELEFDADRCLGCGLCVTPCPVDAVTMVAHKQE